jgi:hypothetical protein
MAYGDIVGWFQSAHRAVGEVLVIVVGGKSELSTKSESDGLRLFMTGGLLDASSRGEGATAW